VGSLQVRQVLTRYYKGPCGLVPVAREICRRIPVTIDRRRAPHYRDRYT